MNIGNQDEFWVIHVTCGSCSSILKDWLRVSGKAMLFAVSRVCGVPQNHHDD